MGLLGYVISTQMPKTVKVRVPQSVYLPKYKKTITRHTNVFAHDEQGQCLVGDVVQLMKGPRFSLRKTHLIGSIVKPAERFTDPSTNLVYTNGHLNIPVGRVDGEGKIINRFQRAEYKAMGLL